MKEIRFEMQHRYINKFYDMKIFIESAACIAFNASCVFCRTVSSSWNVVSWYLIVKIKVSSQGRTYLRLDEFQTWWNCFNSLFERKFTQNRNNRWICVYLFLVLISLCVFVWVALCRVYVCMCVYPLSCWTIYDLYQ